MSLTIHQSGIDAAISAQASGFSGAQLQWVDLYNGASKIKRLPLNGVQVIEPGRIYVVAIDSEPGAYDVTRMEFITSTDQPFATAQHSDGTIIQSKGASATLMLAHQLNISSAPGTVAPSGDVSLFAPQATEAMLGTAELATQEEVNSGSDHTRMVTPKTLKSRLASFVRNASETGTGFIELANQSEVDSGSDHSRAVTPKTLKNWLEKRLSSATASASTTTPANSAAVKATMEAGTREATEAQRGQLEIATQSEAASKSNHTRALTPKRLWEILTQFATRGEAHFVGQIVYSSKETPEPGFFALDGSTIPNGVNDYPELANSGSRYIAISGNNIILKDAPDFIRGKGSSGRVVGTFEGDTIRNITGRINLDDRDSNRICDGALYRGSWISGTAGAEGGDSGSVINHFDASRVVPTSHENRPKALTALICIYHGVI